MAVISQLADVDQACGSYGQTFGQQLQAMNKRVQLYKSFVYKFLRFTAPFDTNRVAPTLLEVA